MPRHELGTIVWGTDYNTQTVTSGGMIGRYVGKNHAFTVVKVITKPNGDVAFMRGTSLCHAIHRVRLGTEFPVDRCKRCEKALARAES